MSGPLTTTLAELLAARRRVAALTHEALEAPTVLEATEAVNRLALLGGEAARQAVERVADHHPDRHVRLWAQAKEVPS